MRQIVAGLVTEFLGSHNDLIHGNEQRGLPPLNSEVIRGTYFDEPDDLDRKVKDYAVAIQVLLDASDADIDAGLAKTIPIDYATSSTLLQLLDKVVQQHEKEGKDAISVLQKMEMWILIMVLFVLCLEAAFLYRPMVKQIKERREELEVQAENLRQANEELEEFAYRTSHDLRAPIISSLKLMEVTRNCVDKNETEKAKEAMEIACSTLKKLEVLVSDILVLTEVKSVFEEVSEVNVERVVDQAIEKIKYLEGFEKIKIIKELEGPANIYVLRRRFQMIVSNLISNAAKYHDPNEDKPFIKIVTKKEQGKFQLYVEDNGLGVPESYQKQLFTMFKRFHPKVAFGSGLGLYMIKKSAHILGGQIAYGDTGKGSRFVFSMLAAKNAK